MAVINTIQHIANNRYRQKAKLKHKRFTQQVQERVEKLLREDYSPEQVVGTLQKQGMPRVSTERIYQYIWEGKKQKGSLINT